MYNLLELQLKPTLPQHTSKECEKWQNQQKLVADWMHLYVVIKLDRNRTLDGIIKK